jgi:hypothetical protein
MDSKKKRNTKPKSTTPNTTMSTKQTLHQLIDDMELQYTSQIEQLESTKHDILVQLEESKQNALEQFKQYESTIQQVRSELEETKKELDACKTKTDKDTSGFKDVSILNQYLKEIYQLKNDNTILTKRFDSTKKLLEQSQKENKHFRELQKELSYIPTTETEELEKQKEIEIKEEEKSTVEVLEEVEAEEQEVVEEPEEEEIDVSKLDIIEVDDVEYYLDLDNQIRNKETLEVVGKVTDDGDAIFN